MRFRIIIFTNVRCSGVAMIAVRCILVVDRFVTTFSYAHFWHFAISLVIGPAFNKKDCP